MSLRWTQIPFQNMIINLNLLAATVKSFKVLILLHFGSDPPFSPNPPTKEREHEEIVLKFPLVLA